MTNKSHPHYLNNDSESLLYNLIIQIIIFNFFLLLVLCNVIYEALGADFVLAAN